MFQNYSNLLLNNTIKSDGSLDTQEKITLVAGFFVLFVICTPLIIFLFAMIIGKYFINSSRKNLKNDWNDFDWKTLKNSKETYI